VSSVQITLAEDLALAAGRVLRVGGMPARRDRKSPFQIMRYSRWNRIGSGFWRGTNEKAKVFKAICPLSPADMVRGQYKAIENEADVAKRSDVETYCALRLCIASWRWEGVPWYLRAGKCLPVTATEIVVELKPPPQRLFSDAVEKNEMHNYLRFRLSPNAALALAARVKLAGEDSRESSASFTFRRANRRRNSLRAAAGQRHGWGWGSVLTRRCVEAAWAVVDPVLTRHPPVRFYEPGSWGPKAADALIAADGGWFTPARTENGALQRPAKARKPSVRWGCGAWMPSIFRRMAGPNKRM